MAQCGQCGKPAIFQVGDVPLCVDCNLKFEQAQEMYIQRERAELDHLADYMESVTGVAGVIPRYSKPQTPIQTGPVTFNNIRVDRSIVGAINTAAMGKLDIVMTNARNLGEGGQKISDALQKLTQAVVDSTELRAATKNEVIENLDFVLAQIGQKGQGATKSGPVKAILEKMNTILGPLSSVAGLWSTLKNLLGLGD